MSRLAFDETNYRDHAIDYLDDLMAADERTAFEMALAKSPEWSAYVEELRSTWRRARIVINEGMQAAPSRVRVHVLAEAAKRAAVLREARASKISAPVVTPGLWAWVKTNLLARPWFAPAFVATAAVGLYVFSQQTFKDARTSAVTSDAIKQEAFEPQAERKTDEAAAPMSAVPKLVAEPVVADKVELDRSKQKTAPPNLPREASGRKRELRDLSEEQAPAKKSVADVFAKRGGPTDEDLAADEGLAGGGAGIGSLAAPRKDVAKGFAQPPSGWPAPSANKVAEAAPAPQAALAESEESLAAPASVPAAPVASRAAGSAGAPAAPRVAQERREKKEARDDELTDDSFEPSLADLVTKAQNAERDGQWTVAVQTYRKLLRRFPKDKSAEVWKQRLAAASAHLR